MSETQASGRHVGRDNHGSPRVNYLKQIAAMTDEQLLDETEKKIWLSAFAYNNPRSDYHWHADACYDEWSRRGKVDQYTVAYKRVERSVRG